MVTLFFRTLCTCLNFICICLDTDGKTVTNYHGKEDGVKDYAKDQGKSQTDEGERYRDTKKKNKGRRVSVIKINK